MSERDITRVERLRCYRCGHTFAGDRNRLDSVCPKCGGDSFTRALGDTDLRVAECPAALNIKGEHFACDMGEEGHAMAHANSAASAIWQGDDAHIREDAVGQVRKLADNAIRGAIFPNELRAGIDTPAQADGDGDGA